MAYPSVTYTFVNGTANNATEVNTNFQNIIDGLSDGTKDLNINGINLNGTLTTVGSATISGTLSVNRMCYFNIAEYTADGNAQGDVPITGNFVLVTSAANNLIMTLPTPAAGLNVWISNRATSTVEVYAPSGKSMNAVSDTFRNVTKDTSEAFMAVDTDGWWYYA
jgi:hypothetical protein